VGQIEDYEELSEKIRDCTKCGLCATRHLVVVDRGDPSTEIVFIGDAPGASEDATGQALVGKAGALFDRLINEAGVEKFLVLNVLKCKTPRNKFPGDEGSYHPADIVEECLPWLDQQLALIKPKVIILVGGNAAAHTIYRGRVAPRVRDIIGKRMRSPDYPEVEVFGIYHMSYILRLKRMNLQDFDDLCAEVVGIFRSAQRVINGEPLDGPVSHVSRLEDRGEQLTFF